MGALKAKFEIFGFIQLISNFSQTCDTGMVFALVIASQLSLRLQCEGHLKRRRPSTSMPFHKIWERGQGALQGITFGETTFLNQRLAT